MSARLDAGLFQGFDDELVKIAGALHRQQRIGRRPISADRLLENETQETQNPMTALMKAGEVSLSGLSPETVMAGSQPPAPMQTPGSSKALEILQRADAIKTASKTVGEHAGGLLRHTMMGAGIGKFTGDLGYGTKEHIFNRPNKDADNKGKFYLTLAGSALGAGSYLRKEYKKHKEEQASKTANISTPGTQLKASMQTGKHSTQLHAGPGPLAAAPKI